MNVKMLSPLRVIMACFISLSLVGCNGSLPKSYRLDVEQGNKLNPEMISKLEPGMTAEQVNFLLGTPLLKDPKETRWDYVYYKQPGHGTLTQNQIAVHFDEDGKVSRLTGDTLPQLYS